MHPPFVLYRFDEPRVVECVPDAGTLVSGRFGPTRLLAWLRTALHVLVEQDEVRHRLADIVEGRGPRAPVVCYACHCGRVFWIRSGTEIEAGEPVVEHSR